MRKLLVVLPLLVLLGCESGHSKAVRLNDEAVALQNSGKHTEAIARFGEAIQSDSAIPEIHNNLAWELGRAHQYDAAVKEFERALELRPGYTEASIGLSKARAAIEARQASNIHF